MEARDPFPPGRTWKQKFSDAFRGVYWGVYGQKSFQVHLLMAVSVVAVATWLRVERSDWCLLLLCIAVVLSAELFNSALEDLAKAVDPEPNVDVGRALDIASGAVLLSATGAAVVGLVVFLSYLVDWWV